MCKPQPYNKIKWNGNRNNTGLQTIKCILIKREEVQAQAYNNLNTKLQSHKPIRYLDAGINNLQHCIKWNCYIKVLMRPMKEKPASYYNCSAGYPILKDTLKD